MEIDEGRIDPLATFITREGRESIIRTAVNTASGVNTVQ